MILSGKPLLRCLGVGKVLYFVMSDVKEKPLGYVSHSLTSAEKGYSQIGKEGLAIVFGVTPFSSV